MTARILENDIKTLDDLRNSNKRLCVVTDVLASEIDPYNSGVTLVTVNDTDSVKNIRNGTCTALLADPTISSDIKLASNCDLLASGGSSLVTVSLSQAVSSEIEATLSYWTEVNRLYISQLFAENGLRDPRDCTPAVDKKDRVIGLVEMRGVFVVLIIGCGVSLLAVLFTRPPVHHVEKKDAKKTESDGEEKEGGKEAEEMLNGEEGMDEEDEAVQLLSDQQLQYITDQVLAKLQETLLQHKIAQDKDGNTAHMDETIAGFPDNTGFDKARMVTLTSE